MNIHRNVLQVVTGALLMVSLNAGAQVLGGSIGGAANGTLGGAGIHGRAAAGGHAGVDATGMGRAARDGARQIAGETREVAVRTRGAAQSDVEAARGTTERSVDTIYSAGVEANRRSARAAAQASGSARQRGALQVSTPPSGGVLANASSGASAEQQVAGRSLAARANARSQASADGSGLTGSTYGHTDVSMKKEDPASTDAAK